MGTSPKVGYYLKRFTLIWLQKAWKWIISPNLKYLIGLVVHNKIHTWESLYKRGIHSLGRCVLCCRSSEDVSHLFTRFPLSVSIWGGNFQRLNIRAEWGRYSVGLCLQYWFQDQKEYKAFPFMFCGDYRGQEMHGSLKTLRKLLVCHVIRSWLIFWRLVE